MRGHRRSLQCAGALLADRRLYIRGAAVGKCAPMQMDFYGQVDVSKADGGRDRLQYAVSVRKDIKNDD